MPAEFSAHPSIHALLSARRTTSPLQLDMNGFVDSVRAAIVCWLWLACEFVLWASLLTSI